LAVDVYCYIERRTDLEWRFTGNVLPNEERQYDSDAPVLAPSYVLHSVNKELASILVDTGWAIRAIEPYTPVVPRRGRPADLSAELSGYFRFFDGDAGTVFSWFTTEELNAFGLNTRIMIRKAFVPTKAASLFKGCPFGFPLQDWPRGVPVKIAGWSRDGTEVTWKEAYSTIIQEFVDVVPAQLAMAGPPDETRLIVMANW
jgi:hypothetical protein